MHIKSKEITYLIKLKIVINLGCLSSQSIKLLLKHILLIYKNKNNFKYKKINKLN